jgi:hypothetical protein
VTRYEGLPVTTVHRTLVDVAAAGLADEQVQQAIQEALRRGLMARESLLRLAASRWGRIKRLVDETLGEEVSVSEVIRELLARWVAGEIELDPGDSPRDRQVFLARAARGMWSDRDPDAYLAASRAARTRRGAGPYPPGCLGPASPLTLDGGKPGGVQRRIMAVRLEHVAQGVGAFCCMACGAS